MSTGKTEGEYYLRILRKILHLYRFFIMYAQNIHVTYVTSKSP